jgi:quercetin dioxygenase-like cupin family protein
MKALLACCIALAHILVFNHAKGQTQSLRQEYRTTANQETVIQSELVGVPGKEATVLRVELPAGWIGDWHYHTGDVFVYVLSGEFVVDVEGQGRKRFGPGRVYHEAVNTTMQARNPNGNQRTELILFQVSAKGEPLMFRAKPPIR